MRSPIKYSWRRRTTRRSIRRTIRRSGVFSPLRSAAIGEGEAMLNCPKTGLFAAAFLAAVALSPASPAGERKGRPWTFEDILLVPEVNELALSADGRSEEHTSELQSLMRISYAVFCLKKKKKTHLNHHELT